MDGPMDMDQILGSTSPESCPLSCCPSVLLSCCASVLLWCLQKGRKQIEGSHRPDGFILFSEKWSGAELLRIDLCRGGNRKSRWDKKYIYIHTYNIYIYIHIYIYIWPCTTKYPSNGRRFRGWGQAICEDPVADLWWLRGCRSTSVSRPKDQDGNPVTWKSRENMHKPRASKQLDILHFISSMTGCRSLLFLTPSCFSSAWTVARGRTPGQFKWRLILIFKRHWVPWHGMLWVLKWIKICGPPRKCHGPIPKYDQIYSDWLKLRNT